MSEILLGGGNYQTTSHSRWLSSLSLVFATVTKCLHIGGHVIVVVSSHFQYSSVFTI